MRYEHLQHLSRSIKKYEPSLSMRRGDLPLRKGPPVGAVVHGTGPGPRARVIAKKWKWWRDKHPEIDTPFKAAVWIYTKAYKYSGGYVVGGLGEKTQVVPDNFVAWHVGKRGSWRYRNPAWHGGKKAAWWREQWAEHGITNPRQFCEWKAWRGGTCSGNMLGIEVVEWTDLAMLALAELCTELADRHRFPCDRYHVLGHRDVHPWARTTKAPPYRAWDPSEAEWDFDRFYNLVRPLSP